MKPRFPTHVPMYAKACLDALAQQGSSNKLSIGGAFGLLHFLDYRPRNDVGAWWMESATPDERQRVIGAIEDALKPFGQVHTRRWGEVASVELLVEQKKSFSFQIASRSSQLHPPVLVPESDFFVDSFPDLVASKMVALVERGAPRDFRDIYAVCQAEMTTPVQCWQLWSERQRAAQGDVDPHRARLAAETHLARIVQHRPLAEISDEEQRDAAEKVRTWFREVFLNVLMD